MIFGSMRFVMQKKGGIIGWCRWMKADYRIGNSIMDAWGTETFVYYRLEESDYIYISLLIVKWFEETLQTLLGVSYHRFYAVD